jgi:hypothetical protein
MRRLGSLAFYAAVIAAFLGSGFSSDSDAAEPAARSLPAGYTSDVCANGGCPTSGPQSIGKKGRYTITIRAATTVQVP